MFPLIWCFRSPFLKCGDSLVKALKGRKAENGAGFWRSYQNGLKNEGRRIPARRDKPAGRVAAAGSTARKIGNHWRNPRKTVNLETIETNEKRIGRTMGVEQWKDEWRRMKDEKRHGFWSS
jgi:hypothetical protein